MTEHEFCARCSCPITTGQRWERLLTMDRRSHDGYGPRQHEHPEDCVQALLSASRAADSLRAPRGHQIGNTAGPMPAARLDILRDAATGCAWYDGLVGELIADRDCHAQRAEDARAEVARLRARVDEAESAMAEETRRAHAMQHERDEYAVDNEAWRSEALRLRARVRVEDEDVEMVGVTRAHAERWLSANGWTTTFYEDGRLTFTLARPRSTLYVHVDGWNFSWIANDLADRIGRSGLDILDEMAAIDIT